jgi:transcriptional regulator with XRE-family HTH domain
MAIASISRRFGVAVRKRRIAAALSQEKLAERAGLHPTYLSMVERAVRNPTLDVSAAIADALQVSLSRIVAEAQRPSFCSKRRSRQSIRTQQTTRRRNKHRRAAHELPTRQ